MSWKMKVGIGSGVLVVFMLSVVMYVDERGNSQRTERIAGDAKFNSARLALLEESVEQLKKVGIVVRVDPPQAYVNPAVWKNLDIRKKGEFSRTLALYSGAKRGDNLNWVEIYDNYSGKRLAKYSENWGFKVD